MKRYRDSVARRVSKGMPGGQVYTDIFPILTNRHFLSDTIVIRFFIKHYECVTVYAYIGVN